MDRGRNFDTGKKWKETMMYKVTCTTPKLLVMMCLTSNYWSFYQSLLQYIFFYCTVSGYCLQRTPRMYQPVKNIFFAGSNAQLAAFVIAPEFWGDSPCHITVLFGIDD